MRINWDKAAVIEALRHRRAVGFELNIGAIQKSDIALEGAIRRYFGGHDAALRAAGIDPQTVRKKRPWDKDRIVKALRERHSQGKKLSIASIRDSDCGLAGAIQGHFGGHVVALRAAGINPVVRRPPRLWDQAKVIAALQGRIALGLDLSRETIRKSASPLYGAIYRHFGNYDEAMRAAGLDPDRWRKCLSWDKPAVMAALRDRLAKGLAVNCRAIQNSDARLAEAILGHFGTHDAALCACGIDPISVRLTTTWDEAKIIAALLARKQQGQDLSVAGIASTNLPLSGAIRRYFGAHDEALRAAGIDPASVRKLRPSLDKSQVLSGLRALAMDGAVSFGTAWASDRRIPDAAKRLFGSLEAAAHAAGLSYARPQPQHNRRGIGHWTEELVLQTLRDLHRDGLDLRHRHMKERCLPLFFAAKHFFGSYVNAVRQAGIDYLEMSQAHLTKARDAAARGRREPAD